MNLVGFPPEQMDPQEAIVWQVALSGTVDDLIVTITPDARLWERLEESHRRARAQADDRREFWLARRERRLKAERAARP